MNKSREETLLVRLSAWARKSDRSAGVQRALDTIITKILVPHLTKAIETLARSTGITIATRSLALHRNKLAPAICPLSTVIRGTEIPIIARDNSLLVWNAFPAFAVICSVTQVTVETLRSILCIDGGASASETDSRVTKREQTARLVVRLSHATIRKLGATSFDGCVHTLTCVNVTEIFSARLVVIAVLCCVDALVPRLDALVDITLTIIHTILGTVTAILDRNMLALLVLGRVFITVVSRTNIAIVAVSEQLIARVVRLVALVKRAVQTVFTLTIFLAATRLDRVFTDAKCVTVCLATDITVLTCTQNDFADALLADAGLLETAV